MVSDSIRISHLSKIVEGHINLEGSKSISNRLLIINALTKDDFIISGLSPSDDTRVLKEALKSQSNEHNIGHAGTSFRFLTAYFAFKKETQILTGSKRMKQRPIGPLVDALNAIGANISYLESEGYPPLKIDTPAENIKDELTIDASISSQFISALCLIAPTLPKGLTITLDGDVVSKSYILMTLKIMEEFGIKYDWNDAKIEIKHQNYLSKDYKVEADWSAASYYYIIVGLSAKANITISGLKKNSLQGDAIIQNIAKKLGVHSHFDKGDLILTKSEDSPSPLIENDFLTHPDIAQSVFCLCAGLGTQGLFTGLQTLRIKETDRIAAMKKELGKFKVSLAPLPTQKFSKKSQIAYYMQQGKAILDYPTEIETYHDHRMAMSFGAMAILKEITIKNPSVVTKSYPNFWNDLKLLGFEIF